MNRDHIHNPSRPVREIEKELESMKTLLDKPPYTKLSKGTPFVKTKNVCFFGLCGINELSANLHYQPGLVGEM